MRLTHAVERNAAPLPRGWNPNGAAAQELEIAKQVQASCFPSRSLLKTLEYAGLVFSAQSRGIIMTS